MKDKIYKIVGFGTNLVMPLIHSKPINISEKESRDYINSIYEVKELFNDSDIVNKKINKNVDLSIIVPVYNAEKYLNKCIESCCNQSTTHNYEVIIINDGSTDNSLKLLNDLKLKYNFKLINIENNGVGNARNVGINNSVGKYIAFVDSDDYIEDNFVEVMLSNANKSNSDIVVCGYNMVSDLDASIISSNKPESIIIKNDKDFDYILKLPGYPWSKIYKRELWNDVRFPVHYQYEDSIIRSVILNSASSITCIEDILCNYVIRKVSLSHGNDVGVSCLDQYFIQEKVANIIKRKKIKHEDVLYKIMSNELGNCLWSRTRKLDKEARVNIFNLACYLQKKYKVKCNLSTEEKYIEKSLENFDFRLWCIASLNLKLKSKRQNE